MSRWFRMHDELLDDPKVQRLPPQDFKGWVNLLCLASRNDGRLPTIPDIAFALRETEDGVSLLIERLIEGGLIERRKGHLSPYKWGERQYKSDTSTDRVKRFRERSKPVAETPPETETETETEQKETPLVPLKGGGRGKTLIPSDWKPPTVAELPPRARACAERWTPASYETEAEAFVCYWRSERKMKADWEGTWANRVIARNSAILRDQKFGNAAPDAKAAPLSRDEQITELKNRIEFYTRIGRDDDVRECRRKIARLEGASAAVATLARQIGRAA